MESCFNLLLSRFTDDAASPSVCVPRPVTTGANGPVGGSVSSAQRTASCSSFASQETGDEGSISGGEGARDLLGCASGIGCAENGLEVCCSSSSLKEGAHLPSDSGPGKGQRNPNGGRNDKGKGKAVVGELVPYCTHVLH